MNEREKRIRAWFDMWLSKKDTGIAELFTENAVYVESWGPKYIGAEKIRHWFTEWNTRGTVLVWDIKQYFHKDGQTLAEWYFKNQMDDGRVEEFDGITRIEWTPDNRISFLKEFGCNIRNYDPYENGAEPQFREETAGWF